MIGACHLVTPTVGSMLMFLLASRDTTASTLTFIVYMFAMHPKVMTRLRQEILDKVGPIGTPNRNVIKDMKYLRAVINGTSSCANFFNDLTIQPKKTETLRLFPAV